MAGEYAKKFLEERAREKGVSPSVYEKKSAKTTESYAESFLREREENKAKSLLGRLGGAERPLTAQERAVQNVKNGFESGFNRLSELAADVWYRTQGITPLQHDLERSAESLKHMLEPLRTEKANWDAQTLLKEIGALDKEIAASQSRADHLYGTLRKPQSIKMPDYGAIGEELDAQARLEALGIGLKERQDAYAAYQEQYAPEMDMYGPYLDESGQLVQHGAAQKYQEMMDAQQAYDDALALYQDKVKAADQAREDENMRQSVAKLSEIYNNQKNQADQAQQLADQLTAERSTAMQDYYRALETGDLVKKNQENPYTRTSDETRIAAAIGTGQAGTYTREMQIMDQMTDAELAVMTYLRNTQGEDAASAYFDYKRSELEKRRVGQGAQIMYKYGSEQPAGASLVSVWQNLGGAALSPAKIAEDLLTGQEIGSANDEFEFGTYRDAAREGVMKDMGGAGRFLYQTGMSMLDSAASAALLGKTFGSLALSSSAGVDTIRSAKEIGASDGQALTLGLVAGAAEALTEKAGFERLGKMFGGSRGGIVRSIAENMVSEFGEESATELANLLADVFVMGDKSQFNQLLSANMKEGLSPTDAAWQAIVSLAGQVGLAGLGGAISGGVMGGSAVSLGKIAQYIDEKASQTATEKAAPLPSAKAETTVEQLAQETADAEMELEKAAQEPMRATMDLQANSELTAAAQQYGEDAGAFTANYEQGDVAAYNRAFDTVYRAGQSGLPLESVKQAGSELIRGMSEGAVKRIYQAGQQQAAKTVTPGVKKMYSQKLSGEQRMQIRVLDALGKEYGVEYDVVPTISDGVNAAYAGSGRRIVVALDALDNAYVQAGVHELVHYLKSSDSAAYGVVEEMVVSYLKKDAEFDLEDSIAGRIRAYGQRGQQLTREAALEEVVAEALPAIFADKESVRELVRTNRTLAEKIRDFLVDFVDKIKKIAERYAYDNDRAEVYAMLENREELVEIARTFDTALRSVDERAGKDSDVPANGGEVKTSNNTRDEASSLLSSREYAQFYGKIGEMKIGKKAQFHVSPDGLYIFDIGNKLVYTDGNWEHPKIFNVIEFNFEDGTNLDSAMYFWTTSEDGGLSYERIQELLADVFGEEAVRIRHRTLRRGTKGENRTGARADGSTIGRGNQNNETGEGKVKFSLNEEQTAKALEEDWRQVSAGEIVVQDLNVDEKAVRRQASEALNKGLRDKLNQQINMAANRIIRDTESRYNRAELRENLGRIAKAYASTGNAALMAQELAEAIIDKSVRKAPSEAAEAYKGVREQLRNAQITLTETQKQEVASEYGSVDAYRKEVFGTVHLRSEGTSLDSLWGELSEKHPEIFPPDTGEAQMPGVLAQFDRMMRPRYENVYGMDAEAAATDLALRIQGDVLGMVGAKGAAQKLYTTADKLRKQIRKEYDAEIRTQQKARVEEFQKIAGQLKEAKEKGDAESRKEIMAKYRAALKKVDAKTAIAEMRAAEKVRNEQRTEAMERARVLNRVQKQANRLRGMLEKPVKGKRVPTFMQESVLKILELLDINSEYSAGKGLETQNAAEWRERLSALRNAYDSIWASQSRGDIPPELDAMMSGLNEKILEDIRRAADALERGEAIRLGSMNSAQLREVETLLRGVYHTIDSIGKLWRSQRYESVAQLGEASMEQMDSRKEHILDGALGKGRDFLALDMMEPVSYAERLGEGGQEVIQSLMDGQKEKFARMREGAEAVQKMLDETGIKGTDIGKWRRHIHQIRTDDGHVLRLNDVQLMDIDLTARRPQGLQHLLISGMKINTHTKTGPKAVNVQITQADLARMQNLLTDEQKALAERMQQYLAVDVAKWGNDVTQRMYLYDAFGEKTYWPLSSDPNALKTQEPEMDRSLTALTNPGFLKPLVAKANNPLVITDAVERYSRHVAEMASYSGMAEAMTDALGWLNYRRRGEKGGIEGSVKGSIERLIGPDGVKYMTVLLQDINGARSGEQIAVIHKLESNYKKVAVAGKFRVSIQQPTSIVRAMAEIDPAYLLTGLVTARKGTVAEMQAHSALAWWKSNGNYEIGVGKSAEQVLFGETSRFREVGGKISTAGPALDPGKWDDFAWARIWTAVKRETKRLHPELTKGTIEYWQHVERRFDEIVDRTQVVDTVLHRSALLRKKDGLVKLVTAFQSEPIKTYNMLARSAMEIGRNPKDKKAYLKFVRASAAFVLTAAVNSAATALFDTFKYRDDDDPIWEYLTGGGFWRDYKAQWWKGFRDGVNPIKLIPFVKQVYEYAEAKIKGESYKDTVILSMEGVKDMVDAADNILDYMFFGNSKKLTAYGAFSSGLRAFSEISGMPFAGALANAEFVVNIVSPGLLARKAEIQTLSDAYAKLYEYMVIGDKDKAAKLRSELTNGLYGGTPKSAKEIDKGVSNALAVNDERILTAWQMRESGNQSRELATLYSKMQREGFTEAQIKAAVNSVEGQMQSQYRDLLQEAEDLLLEGDKKGAQAKADEAEALKKRVKRYGMELEEPEAKDMDEQLKAKTYTYDHLHASIRNGDVDDVGIVAEVMERESDAQDPAKAIRNAVSGEFRKEYVELVMSGQTGKANELAKKLAVVGIDEEDLGDWVQDQRYEDLDEAVKSRNGRDTQEIIGKLREEGKKDEDIASSISGRYKEEYIQLVISGETSKARELAKFLQELGLVTEKKKENCFRQSKLDGWVEAYEEKMEEGK